MLLLAPLFAGNSSDSTVTCMHSSNNSPWVGSDLAAGDSLSCSGSFSFSQDAIEAGDLSPAVTATAANLAAAVTQPLPAISVPNSPSLSVAIDTPTCVPPTDAGMLCRLYFYCKL
jgi:hypothetical protein